MRLFAALLPSVAALDELAGAVRPLRAVHPELRWERRELMHVTVAFFGEIDETTLERLLPRLERAAGRYAPMGLSLAGAGAFPSGVHARVLWTGVYGDRRALARLAASCSAAGSRAGSPADHHRGFRPHLTLARSRRPTDLRPLTEELAAFAGAPWAADTLHLVRSHLGAQVRYEYVRSWPLG
ncbi:RNA 2',3'-cyclic phosphodiesterase [Actinomadura craniellae]|uniref:RNA 2',3'-cyclic phosphodiesterase n=1 Tax=Actinomadura craniellae TaxID=2231787 RepID=A0A365H973_9ACTN|nr:RNA 2',3'-cyclic phosphodiesterase [Actinomadura craniellae]RAY15506.1 RNA 2',3'-cyclic phosphodiesterase [Actinomadura craniellae]